MSDRENLNYNNGTKNLKSELKNNNLFQYLTSFLYSPCIMSLYKIPT